MSQFQGRLAAADLLEGDEYGGLVQQLCKLLLPGSAAAQELGRGSIEDQPGLGTAGIHAGERTALYRGTGEVHKVETGYAIFVIGNNHHEVGDITIGYRVFFAVQCTVCDLRGNVQSSHALAGGQCADQFSRRQFWQVMLLLLLAAPGLDRLRGQVNTGREGHRRQ